MSEHALNEPWDPSALSAVTLDLDDTLWPIAPIIVRAEQVLHAWLLQHAPATAAAFPVEVMRALRTQVALDRPDLGHDLTALRLEATRLALVRSGDDPALAQPAFELFFAERQRVTLYPEVAEALDRLAARWPLLAVTNGNADLQATGLSRWFVGSVGAREVGVAKPHPRVFGAACEMLRTVPERVLHVGDDWHCDIVGAREAGMHTAWVTREEGEGAHRRHDVSVGSLQDRSGPLRHVRVRHLTELADQLGV